jgi:hypothetical protein
MGWVGLGRFACGLGWVGLHEMDPWTTLDVISSPTRHLALQIKPRVSTAGEKRQITRKRLPLGKKFQQTTDKKSGSGFRMGIFSPLKTVPVPQPKRIRANDSKTVRDIDEKRQKTTNRR